MKFHSAINPNSYVGTGEDFGPRLRDLSGDPLLPTFAKELLIETGIMLVRACNDNVAACIGR